MVNSLSSRDTVFVNQFLVAILPLLPGNLLTLSLSDVGPFSLYFIRDLILWFWKSDSQTQSSMCHFSKEAYLRDFRQMITNIPETIPFSLICYLFMLFVYVIFLRILQWQR